MRAFIAFTKKELIESVRTYKLLIVFAVFLLFGMLNPITAKILPELLSSLMPDGMTVTLGDPVALDSWVQFFKNMPTQLIVFVIIFCGVIASELSKGTLVNMLTKGLPRKTVVLSKFTSLLLIWTVGYLICFLTTYGYTLYLLPGALVNTAFAAFCMWLFGVLIISVMLLGGILFGNIYGALLTSGGFSVLLMLIGIIPQTTEYNPYLLSSGNLLLLTGAKVPSDFTAAIIITCVLIVGFIALCMAVFDKKQI